jgi:hypothetical protein
MMMFNVSSLIDGVLFLFFLKKGPNLMMILLGENKKNSNR